MAEDAPASVNAAAALFEASEAAVVVVRGDDFRIEWANAAAEGSPADSGSSGSATATRFRR